MSNLKNRQLSVYERQQLLRANLSEAAFLEQGEMPVEYFTGQLDFAGLSLQLNPAVLIPRVETEELLALAMKHLSLIESKKVKVLELGTGSGAISLGLIKSLAESNYLNKDWQFLATDISAPALAVAKDNYQKLLANNINQERLKLQFLLSDLLKEVDPGEKYDLIVANLPYIPDRQLSQLDESVKSFEPHLALFGGKTGFELIARFLEEVLLGDFLSKEGLILLEVDQTHDLNFIAEKYPQLLKKFKFSAFKDQYQRQRFLSLKAI